MPVSEPAYSYIRTETMPVGLSPSPSLSHTDRGLSVPCTHTHNNDTCRHRGMQRGLRTSILLAWLPTWLPTCTPALVRTHSYLHGLRCVHEKIVEVPVVSRLSVTTRALLQVTTDRRQPSFETCKKFCTRRTAPYKLCFTLFPWLLSTLVKALEPLPQNLLSHTKLQRLRVSGTHCDQPLQHSVRNHSLFFDNPAALHPTFDNSASESTETHAPRPESSDAFAFIAGDEGRIVREASHHP